MIHNEKNACLQITNEKIHDSTGSLSLVAFYLQKYNFTKSFPRARILDKQLLFFYFAFFLCFVNIAYKAEFTANATPGEIKM